MITSPPKDLIDNPHPMFASHLAAGISQHFFKKIINCQID